MTRAILLALLSGILSSFKNQYSYIVGRYEYIE